jgi:hypothetical protein
MAHWNDARIAIEKRFNDNWTTTPKRFWSSNTPFEIPTTAYVAIQIDEMDARQISFGNPPYLHRYDGLITIQILVPERTGPAVADGYCDTLDTLFRCAQFSYNNSGVITCRTPQKRTVGITQGWYQVNLLVQYKRDKIH